MLFGGELTGDDSNCGQAGTSWDELGQAGTSWGHNVEMPIAIVHRPSLIDMPLMLTPFDGRHVLITRTFACPPVRLIPKGIRKVGYVLVFGCLSRQIRNTGQGRVKTTQCLGRSVPLADQTKPTMLPPSALCCPAMQCGSKKGVSEVSE